MGVGNLRRRLPAFVAASAAVSAIGAFADSAYADPAFYCDKQYSPNEVCRLVDGAANPLFTNVATTGSSGGTYSTGTHCNNAYSYIGGQKANPYDACAYASASASSSYANNPSNPRNPMLAVYNNKLGEQYKGSYTNY